MIVAGLQVPVIMLFDITGSAGAVLFRQSGPIGVNTGITWLAITTSMVVVVAHWPAAGVNVYVVVPMVAVLIVAGIQVPGTALLEVAGNAGAELFWHKDPGCVNVGVNRGLTAMLRVALVAH